MISPARCALAALSLLTISLSSPVHAQSYPSRNINLIVSIGPGTGMDVLARLYAEKLAARARQAGGGREQARRRHYARGRADRDLAVRRPYARACSRAPRWRSTSISTSR